MISDAESVVMEALWRREPLTSEEIFAEVAPARSWTATTVKTLLSRLVAKGAISAERDGRRFSYRPLITREAYVSAESQDLLDRLFGGRLAPLMSHFSEQRKLTPEDLAELKRLIEELDRNA